MKKFRNFPASSLQSLPTLISIFIFTSTLVCSHGKQKAMKFVPPSQSEEETHSSFLPANLKCDACQAISFQMYKRLSKFNRLHKNYHYDIPEYEVIDLMEESCGDDVYQGYGLKTVNGENRLNGEGIKVSSDVAGMIAGGGKWPNRLSKICQSYIEQLGDEGLYALYRQKPSDYDHFYKVLCEGVGKATASCVNRKEEKELKGNVEEEEDEEDEDEEEDDEEDRDEKDEL